MKYKVSWDEITRQTWSTVVEADSEENAIQAVRDWDESMQEGIELEESVCTEGQIDIRISKQGETNGEDN